MISEFDDPLEAAKHVVSESYRLWLTYDDRTDDISIIIIEFDKIVEVTGHAQVASGVKRQMSMSMNASAAESKPVRRVMSKEKRKVISEAWAADETEEFNFEKNKTVKSAEEMARIEEMVRANFMFQSLSRQQREQIFWVMKLRTVKEGELIIKEGDEGDVMYIIDSGEFTVLKRDENGINQAVFTYTSPGAAFGELSLMYGKPRAASVRAKTDGRLWSIDRLAFRSVLMKRRQAGLLKTLQGFSFFSAVSYPRLQRLCDLSTEENFNDGDVVATSKEPNSSWTILIVLQGSLSLETKTSTKQGQRSVRSEGSLLASAELGQSVLEAIAVGRTKVARIPTSAFVEIIGEDGNDIFLGLSGSPRMVRSKSIWSRPENLVVERLSSRNDFVLENIILAVGEFAYIATYKQGSAHNARRSVKVIAKSKAAAQRMEERLLNERKFLAAIQGQCTYISKIRSCLVEPRVVLMVYEDLYMSDLSTAIQNDALSPEVKRFCVGAIFQAIRHIHEHGLVHRFINSTSVYLTPDAVPKLADMRYAKKMDGTKIFTICGDPLYFAPEIVSQQGYDYSVDLWAYGVLAYEIFEVI
jgi:hypothetical protein